MDLQESGHSHPACPDIEITAYSDPPPRYSFVVIPPPAYDQLILTAPGISAPQERSREVRQVCSPWTARLCGVFNPRCLGV